MNVLNESNILEISRNFHEPLMALKNVVGVAMGYKKIKNMYTNGICLVVLVTKKLSKCCLEKKQLVPTNYMGIKTDVIEIGTITSRVLNKDLNDTVRPLEGGYAIGPNAKIK